MSFKFASLGSGSRGNGLLVSSGEAQVLVDCGFSILETERRLGRLDVDAAQIDAVLVTHEHDDHVGGVAGFAKKYSLPVHCTPGTFLASSKLSNLNSVEPIKGYASFKIKNLLIEPYPVPHDAREPSQFTITCGNKKLGILTDCGSITPHMERQLTGCSALFIEFNHDAEMLKRSQYPLTLKERISGRYGHISNSIAVELLGRIKGPQLQYVVAAHLSKENNDPNLVRKLIADALGWSEGRIDIATQDLGVDWRIIGST
ncbi:MAG: MBL fold metallo-hydrolase [Proteobacteria bacterium]|nr:MBL fold metallo-hydrolase [Pseudomonadota bacterium]